MKVINSALLKNAQCSSHQVIALPDTHGFQKIEGVLVGKINGKWVAYDDVCDHNGGTLCLDASKLTATCPLHKWTLILNESKYENGCPKHGLAVFEENNQLTIHKTTDQFPAVDTSALSDCPIRFHFNAHASVSTSIAGLNIITDPWLTGSCFATGWWHIAPPSE